MVRQRIDSWLPVLNRLLSTICRIIGAVGLVYEIFLDHLREPTALVVFGGLAGLPDVLGIGSSRREKLHQEREEMLESLRKEQEEIAELRRKSEQKP